MYKDEKKALVNHFSGRSPRTILTNRNHLLVAKKYEDDGSPVKVMKHSKIYDLNLREATFLWKWKESDWDFDKAVDQAQVKVEWARKFTRSLVAENYRKEDERDAILSEIPTPTWIKARYAEAGLGLVEPTDNQKWASNI